MTCHPDSICLQERCSHPMTGPFDNRARMDAPLSVVQAKMLAEELDALWQALPEEMRETWTPRTEDFNRFSPR